MRDEGRPVFPSSLIPHPSSLRFCRRATARANSNFPLAFRLLPPPKRAAMFALYAFARLTDDISDGPGDAAAKRAQLNRWRAALTAALDGAYSHRVHAAVHHTVRTFDVPPKYLFDVIDGVEA